MPGTFDPYHLWLGIPPREQPPHHYRLLGVNEFEHNLDVIENAADRQMAHVRSFQTGIHAARSRQLLGELTAAKNQLLDAAKKVLYDAALRSALASPTVEKPLPVANSMPVAKAMPTAQPMPVASTMPTPRPLAPILAVSAVAREAASDCLGLGFDPEAEAAMPRPPRKERSTQVTPAAIATGIVSLLVLGVLVIFATRGTNSGKQPPRRAEEVATVDPNAPEVFLRDLPPHDLHLWGTSRLDDPVLVEGVASPHGLFTHPTNASSAHVAYTLNGNYRSFSGAVGINDIGRGTNSALTFRIVADGKTIWTSPALNYTGESEPFEVSVAGKQKLELFVDCPGSSDYCHAGWIEPILRKRAASTKNLAAVKRQGPGDTTPKSDVFLRTLPARHVAIVNGTTLTSHDVYVRGKRSPHNVYMHPNGGPPGHATWLLQGNYRSFAGSAGIPDTVADAPGGRTASPLTFRIAGDRKTLWKSRRLTRAGESEAFEVSVAGVDKLELFVECPGSPSWAHAAWIEPWLTAARPDEKR